jgi:hypothetical protein
VGACYLKNVLLIPGKYVVNTRKAKGREGKERKGKEKGRFSQGFLNKDFITNRPHAPTI